jgi:hypothetical protein
MCFEKKTKCHDCGHYGDSWWAECPEYPECGHSIRGIPYEAGGVLPQDDITDDPCWCQEPPKKVNLPPGMRPLPDDYR